MNQWYKPANASLEEKLLNDLSSEIPWSLIERFSELVRESGSEDEREAARYITSRLDEFAIPYQVYEPKLFLSIPISASLRINGQLLRAKTPSFSISTGAGGITGECVYLSSVSPENSGDSSPLGVQVQYVSPSGGEVEVLNKIVLIEGFGFEGAVHHFEKLGAKGLIYINPGEFIHSGICTTIWGAPDLNNASTQPQIPVVIINKPDGEDIKKLIREGKTKATLETDLKEGWFNCPLIVADIQGQDEPERFVLVHGHYDSWYVGIGDNAVGDATLLELARVFNKNRMLLARSLKIAWWPGHSTGRYAGSTWFVDTFGVDIAKNCIAHIDIDSPGTRWATEYYDISWMKEAEDFCIQVIHDATGKHASGIRPLQAGDYSFNNIGVTGFFLLLSSMPKELIEEKGYYPVGGCGGNIEWHTEYDTIEVADRDNLMRDMRVYVSAINRLLNNALYPFDFRNLIQEFDITLMNYAKHAGDEVDFNPSIKALNQLKKDLINLYDRYSNLKSHGVKDAEVRLFNNTLLELSRILIPINFTCNGLFWNEPSISIPPLPDLAPVLEFNHASGHQKYVLRTHLVRGLNRVVWSFEQASAVAQKALKIITEN